MVQNQPDKQETAAIIPGLERSPGEVNGNSSILAWNVTWAEEPGRL